jgi:hypothetical protein
MTYLYITDDIKFMDVYKVKVKMVATPNHNVVKAYGSEG